ncbi:scaffold attachment factor B1-like isoform X2 [Actinia tenebrosa]|uniref:Scaffold attachment factor B1-like isoform X2 n=1 Tax=Actinia tenebrosa TaxID=6105 RepID=A0A6P8HY39_ACTTE|nr:scaffold attachment factor B1-like isoform X2 [Actinia tenebrosa]
MADVQTLRGKKLTELRVVDLRQELENRGLEKSGVKAVLVERLQKALEAQAAEEKDSIEVKDEANDEVNEEPEDVNQEESAETFTEVITKSETKSEPGEPDTAVVPTPPKRSSVKPSKKTQKKKATSEKETPVKKVDQKDNGEDDLLQESFDGEGVIMKIIDECQDDQGDHPEGMEVNDSTDVDELFKDESLNPKTEEGEERKDELGLSLGDSDLNMETGNEVGDDKNKDAAAVGSEEVPSYKDAISLGNNSANSIKGDTSTMDVSEADSSKNENGWSVSLIVHTDGIQDDLDEELKAAEKAEEEAAKEKKEEQKQEKLKEKEEKSKEDKSKETDKKEEKKEKTSEKSEKASKSEGKSSTDSKDTSKSSAKKTPDKKPSTAKKSTTAKGAAAAKEKKESGKSLWVSNLSSITRAADLKTRFSQHGKVVGAKIVTNSKAPGAQCFGLVTMSTSEEAAKCISHLHRTELHGRTITVDRAKGDRIPSQGGASATKKQPDKKQADKKADKSQEKGKVDEKKQTDKGKKTNEKTTKPSGKQSSGSSPSASKKDDTTQGDAKKTEDASERTVVMDDNKGEPVVVVPNKQKEDGKSRSESRGRKSKSSEKSAGSPIKSLEEIRRQRVEKQRQDRAREMRDQRERERALRLRRERERIARERAIEREREREREKERERRRQQFLREQRQKQEQERLRLQRELERRRELERLRREREERERLERERRERELIMERERLNRERIETDRLKRIERERLERQRLERERADRERLDRERLERLDRERRGSGIKRPAAPFERDTSASQRAGFWQDPKRAAVEGSRPDTRAFFGGSLGSHDAVSSRRSEDKVQIDRRDSKGHRDDARGHSRSGSRDGRHDDDFSRSDDRRRKDDHSRRGEVRDSRKDVRHPSDRDKGWSERIASANAGNMGPIDPQKSLSILLERAGVSGILGANAPGVRGDLGKGMDLDIGRSLSADHRGGDWRQADLRDGRPSVMSADRGQHVPVVGGVDSRYGAIEHAHRPSAAAADQVKVTSRDWRGEPSAELLASRTRSRARGMDSKSTPHGYEIRDRAVLSRDSSAVRGAWGGDSLHPSGPPLPGRGMIDDRSRGSALPREAVPSGWAVAGSMPVADVRGTYGAGAGPDRRHSGGGTDVRFDPYKAAAQRSSGMRRY